MCDEHRGTSGDSVGLEFSDDPRQLGLSQSFREPHSPMNDRHFRCKRDGYSGLTIWLFNIAMV